MRKTRFIVWGGQFLFQTTENWNLRFQFLLNWNLRNRLGRPGPWQASNKSESITAPLPFRASGEVFWPYRKALTPNASYLKKHQNHIQQLVLEPVTHPMTPSHSQAAREFLCPREDNPTLKRPLSNAWSCNSHKQAIGSSDKEAGSSTSESLEKSVQRLLSQIMDPVSYLSEAAKIVKLLRSLRLTGEWHSLNKLQRISCTVVAESAGEIEIFQDSWWATFAIGCWPPLRRQSGICFAKADASRATGMTTEEENDKSCEAGNLSQHLCQNCDAHMY